MTKPWKDYEFKNAHNDTATSRWSDVVGILLLGAVFASLLLFFVGVMINISTTTMLADIYHSLTINKWLWFSITLIITGYSVYPMYKIAKYFKSSPSHQANWQTLMERLNSQPKNHRPNVRFIKFNDILTANTVSYINYLFMPNQSFGEAFGSLLFIVICNIINGFSITVMLNFLFVLIKGLLEGILAITPKVLHGSQWIIQQLSHQYALETIFVVIIVVPFVFAKRNQPQWAKYGLLLLQLGGIIGLALSLLI